MLRSNKNIFRVLILAIILVSIPVGVYLARRIVNFFTPAQTSNISLYFEPANQVLPPDSAIRIMLNTQNQPISGARVVFTFDKSKIQLTSEITSTPSFSDVIDKTTKLDANSSGKAVIVVTLPPGVNSPTGIIEFASFNIKSVSITDNDSTTINLTLSDMQVVDTSDKSLPIDISTLTLSLNPKTNTPTPAATSIPTSTPSSTIVPTNTPTSSVTSVPTQIVTPTPTPTITSTPTCSSIGGTCNFVCSAPKQEVPGYKCTYTLYKCCK